MGNQKKMEDYNPEDYLEDNPDFKLPLLSELMGENAEIHKVRFGDASKGIYAVVTTGNGDYRVSSEAIVDKLQKMHDKLEKGIVIRVSLNKKTTEKGTYYYFDVPK